MHICITSKSPQMPKCWFRAMPCPIGCYPLQSPSGAAIMKLYGGVYCFSPEAVIQLGFKMDIMSSLHNCTYCTFTYPILMLGVRGRWFIGYSLSSKILLKQMIIIFTATIIVSKTEDQFPGVLFHSYFEFLKHFQYLQS